MALMSKPCAPMGAHAGGVLVKSSCSSSSISISSSGCASTRAFSFQSSRRGLSSSCGDGSAAVIVGVSFRSMPWRSLHLPTVAGQKPLPLSFRRCQKRLNALVDVDEAHHSLVDRPEDQVPFYVEKEEPIVLEEDEELLKRKAELVVSQLAGSCIFLVGMMGCGKTTVGKYLSESLGYIFFDSDKLVEEAAGGVSVAEMFKRGKEEEFRNAETEVLMQLSAMVRLVVATGGGAVVKPQNWGYMRHGITVWLDVPVDSLAKRIVAVGCHSRPLLGVIPTESAYNQALERLTHILRERTDYYASADAVVSVEEIARERGIQDINAVTPTMIAVKVLEEISKLLKKS